MRVTIAASGQGRWGEELEFPADCRSSGFAPVLIVLDATPNPKLAELERAFAAHDGEVYKGEQAWQHLEAVAGPTMAAFLEKYIRAPMKSLIEEKIDALPEFGAAMEEGRNIRFSVGDESILIVRDRLEASQEPPSELADDAGDALPGL